MRVFVGHLVHWLLFALVMGALAISADFYPFETTVGLFAMLGLAGAWKLGAFLWEWRTAVREVMEHERDERLAKMIARETVREMDRLRRKNVY